MACQLVYDFPRSLLFHEFLSADAFRRIPVEQGKFDATFVVFV